MTVYGPGERQLTAVESGAFDREMTSPALPLARRRRTSLNVHRGDTLEGHHETTSSNSTDGP
jgi:hypothetical protein